jgi:hypothetical protein
MRNLILFLLILLNFSCFESNQPNQRNLNCFNELLGKEKAAAFDALLSSFHTFLRVNYSSGRNLRERTLLFLEDLNINDIYKDCWYFDSINDKKILLQFEDSGMRKEIYLYGREFNVMYKHYNFDSTDYIIFEEEDSLEKANNQAHYDTTLYIYKYGRYFDGLKYFACQDTVIAQYVDHQLDYEGISTSIMINALLNHFTPERFEDPFVQRIIISEIYYFYLRERFNFNK